MTTEKPALLFDLDGTLTDSREGILNSFAYAFKKMDREVPEERTLNRFIGPPIRKALQEISGFTPEEAEEAIALYREYFTDKGYLENRIYEGILQLMEDLKREEYTMAVATSKPEVYAIRILEHFGLSDFFSVVCGSELDGRRDTKDLVIKETLTRLGHKGEAIMIGDRNHDINGAKTHGLATIGVLFGYGSREELTQAGADELAGSPMEIGELVVRKK